MIWQTSGRRTAGGFTLIELMVTVAVLTVIVSIGVPMYGQFTESTAMTSRASELVGAINYTRSEAVSRRTAVRLQTITANWREGWQVSTVTPATVLRMVDLRNAEANVAISEASNITQLDFDGQGRATVATVFTLCPDGGGTGRTVTVNMFGRVRVTQLACP